MIKKSVIVWNMRNENQCLKKIINIEAGAKLCIMNKCDSFKLVDISQCVDE